MRIPVVSRLRLELGTRVARRAGFVNAERTKKTVLSDPEHSSHTRGCLPASKHARVCVARTLSHLSEEFEQRATRDSGDGKGETIVEFVTSPERIRERESTFEEASIEENGCFAFFQVGFAKAL